MSHRVVQFGSGCRRFGKADIRGHDGSEQADRRSIARRGRPGHAKRDSNNSRNASGRLRGRRILGRRWNGYRIGRLPDSAQGISRICGDLSEGLSDNGAHAQGGKQIDKRHTRPSADFGEGSAFCSQCISEDSVSERGAEISPGEAR